MSWLLCSAEARGFVPEEDHVWSVENMPAAGDDADQQRGIVAAYHARARDMHRAGGLFDGWEVLVYDSPAVLLQTKRLLVAGGAHVVDSVTQANLHKVTHVCVGDAVALPPDHHQLMTQLMRTSAKPGTPAARDDTTASGDTSSATSTSASFRLLDRRVLMRYLSSAAAQLTFTAPVASSGNLLPLQPSPRGVRRAP